MNPLDQRRDDLLSPQESSTHDGGDLQGTDRKELQAWHETGSVSEADRSLEQVQRQEAWLQYQNTTNLLDPPSRPNPALEGLSPTATSPLGAAKQLLVVDTIRPDWQQLVAQLPSDADLLLLQPGDHGVECLNQALQRNVYSSITVLPGIDAQGNRSLGVDPLASLQEHLSQVERLTVFDSLTATAIPTAIQTQLGRQAGELVELGQTLLSEAFRNGRLEGALQSTYASANQSVVLKSALGLMQGELTFPEVYWADFEQASVQGAFVRDRDLILISQSL